MKKIKYIISWMLVLLVLVCPISALGKEGDMTWLQAQPETSPRSSDSVQNPDEPDALPQEELAEPDHQPILAEEERLGEENRPRSRQRRQASIQEIGSWDDLKALLVEEEVGPMLPNGTIDRRMRLKLAPGSYQLTQDIEIDLADPFLDAYRSSIRFGLLSVNTYAAPFHFDGQGHKITIKSSDAAKASSLVPLFGSVTGTLFTIKNFSVVYEGNVSGNGFAQELAGSQVVNPDNGYLYSPSEISNVNLVVKGDILSQVTEEEESRLVYYYRYFANGNFNGFLATGFVGAIRQVHVKQLNIHIQGNIGSDHLPDQNSGRVPGRMEPTNQQVGAFGLTLGTDANLDYGPYQPGQWNKHSVEDQEKIIRQSNTFSDINLVVDKSIRAYGYRDTYVAGGALDFQHTWLERLNIHVKGDIIGKLHAGSTSQWKYSNGSFVMGVAEELGTFQDSVLTIDGRLALESAENLAPAAFRDVRYIQTMAGISSSLNTGYGPHYIRRNKVKINTIDASSHEVITLRVGSGAGWNSNGTDGISWINSFENNTFDIGDINLRQQGTNKEVNFIGLTDKRRTGDSSSIGVQLPDLSANNNQLTVKSLTIDNPQGEAMIYLTMINAANAKKNTMTYGDVTVRSQSISAFAGLGNLENAQPARNFYPMLTADNHLTVNNVKVETGQMGYMGLMFSWQDPNQNTKDNTVIYKTVDVLIDGQAGRPTATRFGGIATFSKNASNEGATVYIGDLTYIRLADNNNYFSTGIAQAAGGSLTKARVLVDGDVALLNPSFTYGGGLFGYVNGTQVKDSHYQLTGDIKTQARLQDGSILATGGELGAFAGRANKVMASQSSTLLFKAYQPFIHRAQGGSYDHIVHYIGKKLPKFWSGLVINNNQGESPVFTQTTLLVNKDNAGANLFGQDVVSDQSKDNYVVLVGDGSDGHRVAYATSYVPATEEEMGRHQGVLILKATGQPLGQAMIAKRSFQDRFWNLDQKASRYDLAADGPEKDFSYLISSDQPLQVFGADKEMMAQDGKTGVLADYDHRHAGLQDEKGITYDLFGLKGTGFYKVTYKGNGHTGGDEPVDTRFYLEGEEAVILGQGSLVKAGYQFMGWNSQADGQGRTYQPADRVAMVSDLTLYAKWKKPDSSVDPLPWYPTPTPKPNPTPTIPEGKTLPRTGAKGF